VQQGPPPQLGIPPPTSAYTPTKSTSTTQQQPQHNNTPTTINFGPVFSPAQPGATHSSPAAAEDRRYSLEHPPGYVQNPYAADGTAEQRARLQDAAARESGGGGMVGGDGAAGIWDTLRKGAGEAGEWAKRMEEQAWSLAQGKGDK